MGSGDAERGGAQRDGTGRRARGGLSRRAYLATVTGAAAGVAAGGVPAAAEHPSDVPDSDKRGFVGSDAARGNAINAGWNYNYMPTTDDIGAWHHDSFVPMINGDDLGWTNGAADRVLNAEYQADYVLGYNEPEHEEGYTDANTILYPHWQNFTEKFRNTDVTIVSPSIKTGTGTGRDYLGAFMNTVESDDSLVVDELAVHWYAGTEAMRDDPGTQAQRFLDRMEWLYDTFERPLWITEFGGPNFANVDAQSLASSNVTFLERVIPELEDRDYVRRYAWWTGGPATRLTESVDGSLQLTDVGAAYVGLSDGSGSSPSRLTDLPSSATVDDGRYRLVNENSGHRLEVADGAEDDGANVQQGAAEGGAHQRWGLTHDGDGTYEVAAVHSGKVLDVTDASDANGANVQQWGANDGTHQRWYVDGLDDGTYRLVAAHSGLVLEVKNEATDDGATADQWEWNGGAHQRWRLESVETTGGEPSPVGDGEAAPTDPDGDGLYEDVDGDGETDLADAVTLFQNREDPAVTDHVDAYDFSGNDEIDLADVVELFQEL